MHARFDSLLLSMQQAYFNPKQSNLFWVSNHLRLHFREENLKQNLWFCQFIERNAELITVDKEIGRVCVR